MTAGRRRRRRWWSGTAAVVAAALVAAACGGGGGDGDGGSVDAVTGAELNLPERDLTGIDDFSAAVIGELDRFWAETYPVTFGDGYRPLERVFATRPSEAPELACGRPIALELVVDNAIYCPAEDYVTWDDESFFPYLDREFGPASVAVVLAHEWGHAIQSRARVVLTPVQRELQADCLAGSFLDHAIRNVGELGLGPSDVDGAVAGFLLLRDPPNFDPDARDAHGGAFNRIAAFEEGFVVGVERCRNYVTDGPPIVDNPLPDDAEVVLDLPYGEAVDAVVADLTAFWQQSAAVDPLPLVAADRPCGSDERPVGWCDESGIIEVDTGALRDLHGEIGDFAPALLLAAAYADAVVQVRGLDEVDGIDPGALADCLAGAWVGQVAREEAATDFGLSPGDLDEAVAAFLRFPSAASDGAARTVFTRFADFDLGFKTDPNACLGPTASFSGG